MESRLLETPESRAGYADALTTFSRARLRRLLYHPRFRMTARTLRTRRNNLVYAELLKRRTRRG